MSLDGGKGFVADVMLDFAGVLRRNLRINTQTNKKIGQNGVPLIDFFCNMKSFGGERYITVLVNDDIVPALKKSDGTAHARLGKAHIFGNIKRPDGAAFF